RKIVLLCALPFLPPHRRVAEVILHLLLIPLVEESEYRGEAEIALAMRWINQRTDAVRDLKLRCALYNVTALEDSVFVGFERCPGRVFDLGCLASISLRSFLVHWCGIIAAQLVKLLINRCQIARDH